MSFEAVGITSEVTLSCTNGEEQAYIGTEVKEGEGRVSYNGFVEDLLACTR